MAIDNRDILELLKDELDFIEKGGYGRYVRTPWKATSAFQDSLSCLNYADPNHNSPCNECRLIEFVTREHQNEEVPCHFITLDDAGDTVDSLESEDNEAKLERKLKEWLQRKIHEIEEQRATIHEITRAS